MHLQRHVLGARRRGALGGGGGGEALGEGRPPRSARRGRAARSGSRLHVARPVRPVAPERRRPPMAAAVPAPRHRRRWSGAGLGDADAATTNRPRGGSAGATPGPMAQRLRDLEARIRGPDSMCRVHSPWRPSGMGMLDGQNPAQRCESATPVPAASKKTHAIIYSVHQLNAIVFNGLAAFSAWYLVDSSSYLWVMRATVASSSARASPSSSAPISGSSPAVAQKALRSR